MTRGSDRVRTVARIALLAALIVPAGPAVGGDGPTIPAPEAGAFPGGGGSGGGTGPDCGGGEVHDDGSAENGYGWSSASSAEGRLVEKFTPPSYPWSYERVCIGWSRNGTDSSIDYRIVVSDDDGPGGEPGTMLASVPVTDSGVPVWTSTAIYGHDVQGQVPVIHSGSVCGTTGTYVTSSLDYRDTDWYSFTVAADGYFRIAGGGEQQLQLVAVDRTNCGAPVILGGAIAEAGCRGSFVVWLEAGTYAVFVAPTVYSGLPCAPATRDYWVSIEPAPEP